MTISILPFVLFIQNLVLFVHDRLILSPEADPAPPGSVRL
jgi:hypothetical protein